MKAQWPALAGILLLLGCSVCLAEDLILNPSFEGNFTDGVADQWTAWGSGDSNQGFIDHDGQKSQAIIWNLRGYKSFGPGGIYQQINNLQPGQIYCGGAWFNYDVFCDNCGPFHWMINYAIGVDPNGGTDPGAVEKWFIKLSSHSNGIWRQLNYNFRANSTTATVFIRINGYYNTSESVDRFIECRIDDTYLKAAEFNPQSIVSATLPVPAHGNNVIDILITLLDPNLEPYADIPASAIEVNCSGAGNTIEGPYSTDAAGQTHAWIKSNVAGNKLVTVTVGGELLASTANIQFIETTERYRCCRSARLLAADGAEGDYFGTSVAISGDTAVIGAPGDDDKGESSGSAYIFRFDGTDWIQQDKLLTDDGAAGDYFGCSVAISDNTAVIGATGDDDKGDDSGSAYIFRFDGNDWIQQAKLLASEGVAGDYFGQSVAISGDTTVIGAFGDNGKGDDSGSAYIFRFDGTDWIQQDKLLADDGAAGDYFGLSVAISDNIVLIGAYGDDDIGGAGSAYIFRFDGNNWIQQDKLLAFDGEAGDMFGWPVAISGETVAIGANGDDDIVEYSGSVYIFRFDGYDWVQQDKLVAADASPWDAFGISVAISGDTIIVGKEYITSAYIFRPNDSGWIQQDKIYGTNGSAALGSVAVSGDTAILGLRGDDELGNYSGSAYIFAHQPGDIDGSCDIDFADLSILAEQWLQPPGRPSADLVPEDGDDNVNLLDFAFIAENWLESVLH